MSDERPSFASRLFGQQAPLSDHERLRRARSLAYWRGLDDELSVDESRRFATDASPLERAVLLERTEADGFFITPPLVAKDVLARALLAIHVVERAGWPRVFAFVYDALWDALRAPSVVGLLQALLGEGARQLPGIWVHHVSAVEGARGWGPHVDVPGPARRMDDGAPSRLTAWLALTDATLDNGCLHVVPAPFAGALPARFHEADSAPMNDVIRLLHGVRALPVPAGSLIAWRLDVLHWGGVSTGLSADPRLSLSFELGHESAPPTLSESPSFALDHPVTFGERLSVIGRGLLAYGKAEEREPFAHRFVALGDDLVDEHR